MDRFLIRIDMCDKAAEIQALKPFLEKGDYWCWASDKEKIYLHTNSAPIKRTDSREKEHSGTNRKIWLPTQEQYQDILADKIPGNSPYSRLYNFIELLYSYWLNWQDRYIFESVDQLLLGLVMKKLYNKTWDGMAWVKEVKR